MDLPLEEILKLQSSLQENEKRKKKPRHNKVKIKTTKSKSSSSPAARGAAAVVPAIRNKFHAAVIREAPKKETVELMTNEIKRLKKELKKKGGRAGDDSSIFQTYQKLVSKVNLIKRNDKQS